MTPHELRTRLTRLDTADDLDLVRTLFSNNGYPRSEDEVAWIYEPFEGNYAHAEIAEVGELPAALYAVVPAKFKVGNGVHIGAQSLDTMVDAQFRGRGLFIRMAKRLYASLPTHQTTLVYGFPNEYSYPAFVKVLNWVSLDPVPFMFRPINLAFAISKVSPMLSSICNLRLPTWGSSFSTQKLESLPDNLQLDNLWEAFASQIKVARVRDSAFLEKRFKRHPKGKYQYRAIFRGNHLAGLIIYCVESKHGGKIGYIMELMCRPDSASDATKLIRDTMRDMALSGCDGVLAWCFKHSPYYKNYLRQIFLPLPVKLRPIELHFGFRAIFEPANPLLNDRNNWYLSYSDSDTV